MASMRGPDEVDYFRDTPLRYMGYANELGESFKASISRGLYVGTYAVAIAYALGDALDKGLQAHHRVQYEHEAAARKDAVDSRLAVATAVADTFMWQMAASVVIPGLIINRAVCSTERVVDYMSTSSLARVPHAREPHANSAALSRVLNKPAFRRFAPTAVGLSLIPLIIHPIDDGVTLAMDASIRPVMNRALASALPPSH